MDASPTKAWMIRNRAQTEVRRAFDLGFGKRPREELYDLRTDPDYMDNVATEPAYRVQVRDLRERLMDVLREQDDPRIVEMPCRFEQAPYAGPVGGD